MIQKKKHSPLEWQDIIFKEDLEIATLNFEKHLQDPKHPYDQIVRYKHKDGSTVWIQCRGVAIRDESGKAIRMLGAHTNISNLINAQYELKRSAEQHELVFKATGTGLFVVSVQGICTYVSDTALSLLGYEDENELLGKKFHEKVHHSYENGTAMSVEDCDMLRISKEKKQIKQDGIIWRKDGRYALIEFKLGSKQIEEAAKHLLAVVGLIRKVNESKTSNHQREPDLLMIITGGEMAYTREDGVKIVPIGCLKD